MKLIYWNEQKTYELIENRTAYMHKRCGWKKIASTAAAEAAAEVPVTTTNHTAEWRMKERERKREEHGVSCTRETKCGCVFLYIQNMCC